MKVVEIMGVVYAANKRSIVIVHTIKNSAFCLICRIEEQKCRLGYIFKSKSFPKLLNVLISSVVTLETMPCSSSGITSALIVIKSLSACFVIFKIHNSSFNARACFKLFQ